MPLHVTDPFKGSGTGGAYEFLMRNNLLSGQPDGEKDALYSRVSRCLQAYRAYGKSEGLRGMCKCWGERKVIEHVTPTQTLYVREKNGIGSWMCHNLRALTSLGEP